MKDDSRGVVFEAGERRDDGVDGGRELREEGGGGEELGSGVFGGEWGREGDERRRRRILHSRVLHCLFREEVCWWSGWGSRGGWGGVGGGWGDERQS